MLNLERFFKNIFNTKEISDNNTRKYAEDQLQRMIANNPAGIYNQLITDTTAAYNGYFGAITDEDSKTAIKEGSTIAMNNSMKAFQQDASQKEGIIKGTYGKDSATYQEFYPHGITEYTKATLGNVSTLMERMVTASTAHVADLGAPFVTLFTNHKTNFGTLRTAQLALIGTVAGKKDVSVTTRNAIEVQLMKNVFIIAYYNVGNLEAVNTYFDQSIIRHSQSSATDGIGQARGLTKHAVTGAPISNVEVTVLTAAVAATQSKTDGAYRTKNIPIGMHTLRFVKNGFIPKEVAKEIIDEGFTALDVTLTPEIAPPPPPQPVPVPAP